MKRNLKLFVSLFLVIFSLLSCALLCACNGTELPSENENGTTASIDILKIGKADCIIINTGKNIVMIDTGEAENVYYIKSFMASRGYQKIDTLILTHYDKDHIGGASEIIKAYKPNRVFESKRVDLQQIYADYHEEINSLGCDLYKLFSNRTFELDGMEFEIDIPKKSKYSEKNDNNSSLVISVKYGENKLLFCGDAMELRLEELIDENIGGYDFVKLPYHGNYIDNYEEFLGLVNPSAVAITNSKKNPTDTKTVELLSQLQINAYETRYGDINICLDGKELIINQ
ncbi:MAG: MBL fold metallo-hydrolase [Clostridia bacterium]|nr:MBL fold metallo-hydrolase [Clostridia bacterium]